MAKTKLALTKTAAQETVFQHLQIVQQGYCLQWDYCYEIPDQKIDSLDSDGGPNCEASAATSRFASPNLRFSSEASKCTIKCLDLNWRLLLSDHKYPG